MAKGDAADTRSNIRNTSNTINPALNNLTNNLYGQQQGNLNNYNAVGAQNINDYGNIMSAYRNKLNNADPNMQAALAGYSAFAQNGGFSDQDVADLRARGISPIRSAYQNAMSNIDRQSELQGGYSPNKIAAIASTERQLPQQLADATQNVNAGLAQMRQQGKLAGLQGLGGLSAEQQQLGLGALSGMGSLYSASPGLTNTFGNQVLNNNNQIGNSLNLTAGTNNDLLRMQGSLANAPGDFSIGLHNFSDVLSPISKIGKGLTTGIWG